MPTARELLEQADALMRKNRGRGDADIPVLTDAIAGQSSTRRAPPAEIPVLTEQVEELVVDIAALPEAPEAAAPLFEGDPSDWLVMDTIDPAMHSVTGKAPDTLAVVPPVTLKAAERAPKEDDAPTRATLKAAGSAPTPPPEGSRPPTPVISPPEAPAAAADAFAAHPGADVATDDEQWRAVAEQISMQVLQRIDLFTDTGLKEQLAQHLQPIVERASAELVGAINEHVGKLVRSYVAEAIEREIAQWRRDNR